MYHSLVLFAGSVAIVWSDDWWTFQCDLTQKKGENGGMMSRCWWASNGKIKDLRIIQRFVFSPLHVRDDSVLSRMFHLRRQYSYQDRRNAWQTLVIHQSAPIASIFAHAWYNHNKWIEMRRMLRKISSRYVCISNMTVAQDLSDTFRVRKNKLRV